ncbi:unnamed protein product, partial [Mesorhabditis belari]|uniref:Saposin B-type domain-containing protein n=1 Tax=Mesorhabditis belari TaxID=2138241 RepID=A0AAF3EC52_9BILA
MIRASWLVLFKKAKYLLSIYSLYLLIALSQSSVVLSQDFDFQPDKMRALLLTSFALFGVAWTQTTSRPVDPCSMCEFVVNQAYSHFNKRESKWRVEEELLNDCNSLQRFYGFQAVRDCQGWIKTNIDVIYNDMENNKTPQQICTDMGECGATVKSTAVTAAAAITTTTTVLTTPTTTTLTTIPVDLCAVCIGVIDKTRNSGVDVTDEAALLIELLGDCQSPCTTVWSNGVDKLRPGRQPVHLPNHHRSWQQRIFSTSVQGHEAMFIKSNRMNKLFRIYSNE